MVTKPRDSEHPAVDPDGKTQPSDAAFITIEPRVHENYGEVIGLQVGTITGNVHSTQVIMLDEKSRSNVYADRLEREKCPYPGMEPFTFEGRNLYFGRDGKIAEVLRGTTNHPLVVLYGAPRSGKTSLLCASIMPRIADFGALVARIDRYDDPVAELRAAIAHVPGPLSEVAGSSGSLSELTKSVIHTGGGTFVLILDQFERVFELPEADQIRLVNELKLALADDPKRLLLVIVSIRVDGYSETRLAALQEAIPGLLNYAVTLSALGIDEAREALEGPLLTLDGPVQFATPQVRERILDDLARLSSASGMIDPTALQLVGECLFHRARDRRARENVPSIISPDVYGNGAASIVDECLKDIYERQFSDDRDLADAILNSLVVHQDDRWIARNKIDPKIGDDGRLAILLKRFVDSGFLISRRTLLDEYAFLNTTIAATMERIADDEALNARQARQVLTSAWTEWDVIRSPAGKAQLRFLSADDSDRRPAWPESLLLLRSAVHHREDPRRWLAAVGAQVEHIQTLARTMPITQVPASEIQLLDRDSSTPPDENQDALAWIAARDNDRVDRETAVLALAAAESLDALKIDARLRPALVTMPGTFQQRRRRAGLWGALTDAGVSLEPLRHGFDPVDRFLIGGDRAGRRISRNQRAIWMRAGGAALGMGLGLATLRALIAATTTYSWPLEFSINFLWAALAGLVMGVAIQITAAILDRVADWRVVIAGAIGFGVAHLWIMSSNDLPPRERLLTAGLGFALGAVLAAAVAFRDRIKRAAWVAWIAVAGVSFGLMQALLNQIDGAQVSFPLVQNGTFYGSEWQQETPRLERLLGDWFDRMAAFDAALVGCALMAGLLIGTRLADRWFTAWQDIEAKAGR